MTVTRFAPSPTGYLHIGNLRTALFNFLIARKAGGTFILRLDDTDPARSTPAFADAIQEDLAWLGLTWDRVERQSDRLDRFAAAADTLRGMGRLYEAFETPAELDLKRKKQLNMGQPPVYDRAALALGDAERARLRAARGAGVWRFLLDHGRITWADGIMGDLSITAASVSDPVLIRRDGQVLYTLASVVDDIDMGITDVVRGADHVTNTATQIQLIKALGGTVPRFAHHSLLTGAGGEALSKRLGTLALRELRAKGVEPMAVLSYLARLGSSQPVRLAGSLDELADGFDLTHFGAAPTKCDVDALYPLTARYLAGLPVDAVERDLEDLGVPRAMQARFWGAVRENITKRADLAFWWDMVNNGTPPLIDDADRGFVDEAFALLPEPPYCETSWADWTGAVKDATGRRGRDLFMPLREAITGRAQGPDMAALLPLFRRKPGI
ncbi:MAG: glutamate--tRNA ligase [Rhodobacteraceae bacterium]|nr:glutamate--tRNA ligase [Paracoccaceae bacterium]